jgi:hypothetical protein
LPEAQREKIHIGIVFLFPVKTKDSFFLDRKRRRL